MRRERGALGVLAAIAASAILVGAGVGLLIAGIASLRSSAALTLRSDALLQRATTLEGSIVDAETGLRGYALTTSQVFLQPLRAAGRALPGEVAVLTSDARRDRDFTGQAAKLGAAAQAYMSSYVPMVLALMRQDPARARSYAITLEGKQRVDSIRALATRLEDALAAQGAHASARRRPRPTTT